MNIEESNQSHSQGRRFLLKEHQYKSTLDWLNLCISSSENNNPNSDWYCEHAKILYINASKDWAQELTNTMLEKNAYEAMKLDVSHFLRTIEFSKIQKRPPADTQKLLDKLLGETATILIIGVIAFVFILLVYSQPLKTPQPFDS